MKKAPYPQNQSLLTKIPPELFVMAMKELSNSGLNSVRVTCSLFRDHTKSVWEARRDAVQDRINLLYRIKSLEANVMLLEGDVGTTFIFLNSGKTYVLRQTDDGIEPVPVELVPDVQTDQQTTYVTKSGERYNYCGEEFNRVSFITGAISTRVSVRSDLVKKLTALKIQPQSHIKEVKRLSGTDQTVYLVLDKDGSVYLAGQANNVEDYNKRFGFEFCESFPIDEEAPNDGMLYKIKNLANVNQIITEKYANNKVEVFFIAGNPKGDSVYYMNNIPNHGLSVWHFCKGTCDAMEVKSEEESSSMNNGMS